MLVKSWHPPFSELGNCFVNLGTLWKFLTPWLESEQSFECPTCSHKFSEPKGLQDHIEINHEQTSSLSLVSDTGSNSWMHLTCKICGSLFENEAYLSEHHTRVHETLEELGIKRLPRPDTYNLRGHVHQLTISNKTKKGHNMVCWHQKNYPYHTEFVSWRVDHFSFLPSSAQPSPSWGVLLYCPTHPGRYQNIMQPA